MWFTNWQRESGLRPLYTSLAPEDASAIVQKLRESGVSYRVSDERNNRLLVPEARVPELRLEMAGLGLPKTGRIGFEIFDKTNFGITDFAEHVNYRRAVEGELERSVMAIAEVQQARVHVSLPKDSVFTDSREAAKASVLVGLRPGATLSPQNVAAIMNLVSSAVEGSSPESVSVVDMSGNLLSRPRRDAMPEASRSREAALEYRQAIEHDLVVKINNTLDPLLGAGQVSNRCVRRSGHDQRRAERRELRPRQIGDGHFAKDGGHQRSHTRATASSRTRNRRQPYQGRPCRIRRPAATIRASAPRASPTNPAARRNMSTCRKARSNGFRSRCWWIKAHAGRVRASRCTAW